MHAILGLAAHHLDLFMPGCGFARQGMQHRVKAIQQLNTFISRDVYSVADGDAAFGAVFSLIYQTSYVDDALFDYVTMMRGCKLI